MQTAIDDLWSYTGELFETDDTDRTLIDEGIACDTALLAGPWQEQVRAVLSEATLVMPTAPAFQRGGREGRHTEHLGHLLATMQWLQRAYPGAQW
jgi:ring-1,2-phenylacetyl-CoA epoxidase subunit PaaC